ncbi:acyl-CoA-binding domain-containing protein 4 [Pelodytes ibericus]
MGTDQDEKGYQIQFNAAVSVIQGLPKNGSYRPSYEEMLRFYSYYKQAIAGPCNISRPGFWDPIGRYKWDAWNRLGGMSQEDAMCAYIKEMKVVAQKIIDTVPLHDTSPEMFEPFRPLYEVIPDMPRPPESFFKMSPDNTVKYVSLSEQGNHSGKDHMLKEVGSSSSMLPSAPQTAVPLDVGMQQVEESRSDPIGEASQPVQHVRKAHIWEPAKEEFSNNMEQIETEKKYEETDPWVKPHLLQPSYDVPSLQEDPMIRTFGCDIETASHSTSEPWLGSPSGPCSSDMHSGSQIRRGRSRHQLSPQIKATVEALQTSIQGICQRLESLERILQSQQLEEPQQRPSKETKPWSFLLAQSRTLFLILVWPFIVHWLLRRFHRTRR